jgi:exonuclease SbcC
MTELALRSISISDFRRLPGHRTLPLDAPIVLLHGANGTGKTSILAALEMGLIGQIRSMRRQDPRYTAYLPHHGQNFATIRVELAEQYAAIRDAGPLTVGGSRIEGRPALSPDAAAFFAERCYLDQVSLGQLLELYQYREGKEESALARFVNELLGLEQLDALRTGLHDSTDFRLLKNLSELLDDATKATGRADDAFKTETAVLQKAGADLTRAKADLLRTLDALDLRAPTDDDSALIEIAETRLCGSLLDERASGAKIQQELVALSGRIAAITERQSTARLDAARENLEATRVELERWRASEEAAVLAVQQEVAALVPKAAGDFASIVENELQAAGRMIDRQSKLEEQIGQVQARDAANGARLTELTDRLSAEQEMAGSLVEGLAAIRASMPDNNDLCTVCDRDFSEVSSAHLGEHIDRKLADLTSQGERLMGLRQLRDGVAAEQLQDRQTLTQLSSQLLTPQQRQELENRRTSLTDLLGRLLELEPSMTRGRGLRTSYREAEDLVLRLEEASREVAFVNAELARLAGLLNVQADEAGSIEFRLNTLSDLAAGRLRDIETRIGLENDVREALAQFQELQRRVTDSTQKVAEAAQKKQHWEARIDEARRRQGVARAVHKAAAVARTEVVQHVFTESLNQVWRSVFSRLAPREQYIPAFGIPTTTKAAMELTLQTTHVSGEAGGSPQMMLSAGNLNTAALSLFLALHLAVEPVIPCLVFDDPVQAMDEVHVAQFAGLIRVLAKHHGRQVVIAVHERELFEYLSLELSPAYPGDELITIELGDRSSEDSERVTRRTWTPDLAVAT